MNQENLLELGERLLEVFHCADSVDWDREIQRHNLEHLIEAQKRTLFMLTVPPRFFVFHCCRLLEEQRQNQRRLEQGELMTFIAENQIPDSEA